MKITSTSNVISFAFLLFMSMYAKSGYTQYSWNKLPVVKTTAFPKDTIDIKKFGAIADGVKLNTASINNAIRHCNKNGGGVVLVPKGLWLTGPIEMKSNV